MKNNDIYKVKDSVDLFLNDNTILTAYFMNTRKRKSFKVNESFIKLIEQIDGEKTVDQLSQYMEVNYSIASENTLSILTALLKSGILTEKVKKHILSSSDRQRYARQINYFSEFLSDEEAAETAQKRLMDSQILIFGVGAVGGDIAIQLAMSGVKRITLFDYDTVQDSDIARHMYFTRKSVGQKKVVALKEYLKKINTELEVTVIDSAMKPEDNIEKLVANHTFVVNTLDEPYIGYTSSKISRICVKYKIPHFIAGGFDAHLASTGELIIPYVTPCADCYVTHFTESLKGWKPKKHPVMERNDQMGGLAAMSLFSSSYATMEIIKTITNIVDMKKDYKVRGELMFKDFSLNYLTVDRDPNCLVCGKGAQL